MKHVKKTNFHQNNLILSMKPLIIALHTLNLAIKYFYLHRGVAMIYTKIIEERGIHFKKSCYGIS